MKLNNQQIEAFAAHSIASLPDSLSRRQDHLLFLGDILPPESRARAKVVEMLHHLEAAERIKNEFAFSAQEKLAVIKDILKESQRDGNGESKP